MIKRTLQASIEENLHKFPMVSISGPRQSGKTTLAQMLRPDYRYVSLENPEDRLFATEDPARFLDHYQDGVILDEVQYAPQLFSYLQVLTDQRKRMGEYILTGSQNFLMMEQISQSLAGRVALFQLLPLSMDELSQANRSGENWEEEVVRGFYPRARMQDIDPDIFYSSYIRTYIERDVRLIKNITNLELFQKFLRLLAGRIGQLFNQSHLAQELGVDHKTVGAWMQVLEATFIAFKLPPYFNNFSKRIIKSPKIYFYDTGLVAWLLDIREERDLQRHFARGSLFENLIIAELLKRWSHRGRTASMYHWRAVSGQEVDLVIPAGPDMYAIEIKSSQTIHPDHLKGLKFVKSLHPDVKSYLIYAGTKNQPMSHAEVLSYDKLDALVNKIIGR